MSIEKKEVLAVTIERTEIKKTWTDEAWRGWVELHELEEFNKLAENANKNLEDSKASKIKETERGRQPDGATASANVTVMTSVLLSLESLFWTRPEL